MFSGIIERLAKVTNIEHDGTNVHFTFSCAITSELKIDQSIAHNGVCLTVTELEGEKYKVTAIEETLRLTNLGELNVGDVVNFERCIRLADRLDGHIVQGHVDGTARVLSVENRDGSWNFRFKLEDDFSSIGGQQPENLIIHKGSITINGTSLTVTHIKDTEFGVSIIPYTFEHTNFHKFVEGTKVNIELDVLGKYVAKLVK